MPLMMIKILLLCGFGAKCPHELCSRQVADITSLLYNYVIVDGILHLFLVIIL